VVQLTVQPPDDEDDDEEWLDKEDLQEQIVNTVGEEEDSGLSRLDALDERELNPEDGEPSDDFV
jgi:hypothetical protein